MQSRPLSGMRLDDLRCVLGIAVGAVSMGAHGAEGATLRVPDDYPTLTTAANAAVGGDSILVWRPAGGGDYEFEAPSLRQGVTLRGMEPIPRVSLGSCAIFCSESLPIGLDDTTRVENLSMFESEIQATSPRTSVVDCTFVTLGGNPVVYLAKGGVVARNRIQGGFDSNGISATQGTVVVMWNVIVTVLNPLSIYNDGAPEPVHLRFRNNTVGLGEFFVVPGPESTIEFVNNILEVGWFECEDDWDIRYNDLRLTFPQCTIDEGNIFANPMYCNDALDLDPESPCVGSGENGMNIGARGVCATAAVETEDAPRLSLRLTVHPNPVDSEAEFLIEGTGRTLALEIYDSQGRLIDLLKPEGPGAHWRPAASVGNGIYFARLNAGGQKDVVKFALVR